MPATAEPSAPQRSPDGCASIVTIRCGDLGRYAEIIAPLDDRHSLATLADHRREKMASNPLVRPKDPVRYLAVQDRMVVGREDVFAGELFVGGRSEPTTWGSNMVVPEPLRGRGFGKLLARAREEPSLRVVTSNGVSQMLSPIYRKLGFTEFAMPRMLLICRAHPLLETAKIPHALRPIVTPFANVAATYFRGRVARAARLAERHVELARAATLPETYDQEMMRIVCRARAACHRSSAWVNWRIRNYPVEHPRDQAMLLLITRHGRTIGYVLMNTRYYLEAKGMKDFVLGSVRDWMVWDDAQEEIDEQSAVSLAVRQLVEMGVDGVEVCPSEDSMAQHLRQSGFFTHGSLRFLFKALGEDSPFAQEWCKRRENWRLRPAEGDHFFM